MASYNVTVGTFGEEVGSLHERLLALGISVPDSEVERRFFGPGTQEAVREFQRRNRLAVTGTVDEPTATAIAAPPTARPPDIAEHRPALRQIRPIVQPQASTGQVYRLVDGYVRFGEALWGRSWSIASQSLRRAMREVGRNAVRPRSEQHLFQRLLDEYANCVSSMAMALPLAAEAAAERAAGGPRRIRGEEDPTIERGAPRTLGAMLELAGQAGDARTIPFPLPARFVDASEGWAVYVVPSQVAMRVLGESVDFVSPFDLGGRRTLLAVLGIDYRVSDLGRCREIALALAVTAHDDPAGIPGAMFVGIGVSGEFSRDVAREVWGLRKVFNKDLSVTYRPDRAAFGLGSDHPGSLLVGFPRFGGQSFEDIPLRIYSRQHSEPGRRCVPLRSTMTLSGRRQGWQVGGSVSIRLGSADPAQCVCRGSADDCLCRTLETFAVRDRLPAANGWTEHLSGAFDGPRMLHLSR